MSATVEMLASHRSNDRRTLLQSCMWSLPSVNDGYPPLPGPRVKQRADTIALALGRGNTF